MNEFVTGVSAHVCTGIHAFGMWASNIDQGVLDCEGKLGIREILFLFERKFRQSWVYTCFVNAKDERNYL